MEHTGPRYTLPMVRLALVTCTPQLEVALSGEGISGTSVVRLAGASPRSRLLLAAVDLLMEDAGVRPEDLELVVVTRGPGSFTGIRSGLATAQGLASSLGVPVTAYGSLLVQAARVTEQDGTVWAAQPGRRGELYVQEFLLQEGEVPRSLGPIRVVSTGEAGTDVPLVAAEAVDTGTATRAPVARTAAEAALRLAALEASGEPVEPLYVEGPPVDGRGR